MNELDIVTDLLSRLLAMYISPKFSCNPQIYCFDASLKDIIASTRAILTFFVVFVIFRKKLIFYFFKNSSNDSPKSVKGSFSENFVKQKYLVITTK